jgi:anti-repressor protein
MGLAGIHQLNESNQFGPFRSLFCLEFQMGNMELAFTSDSANVRSTSPVMMDSRELARLLEARHSDVIKSIETQLPKVGYTDHPHTYKNVQNGQEYKFYLLPYRETMILASGFSIELRSKIVDRWIELEGAKTPKTFAEALQLAADQAKLIEQQNTQITLMQPKAEFYDAVTDSTDAIEMKDAAKVINAGIGRNDLMKLLRDKKVLMDNNTPYQSYIDKGYFRVIETKNTDQYGTTRIFLQTVVYQRGVEFIRKVVEKYHT